MIALDLFVKSPESKLLPNMWTRSNLWTILLALATEIGCSLSEWHEEIGQSSYSCPPNKWFNIGILNGIDHIRGGLGQLSEGRNRCASFYGTWDVLGESH